MGYLFIDGVMSELEKYSFITNDWRAYTINAVMFPISTEQNTVR